METTPKLKKDAKINWYRCQVDPAVMSELMQCSNLQGFGQAFGHLGLWCLTGTLAFLAYRQIAPTNWFWSVPLLLAALFAHGTVGAFLGGTACHELSHKTPFKTKSINEFFLKVFAFLGWWDQVWFRPSHIRHHQVTVHKEYDGEVILPQQITCENWRFWLSLFAWNPQNTWNGIKMYYRRATGRMDNEWSEFVMPESNPQIRRQHRNWARFTLIGHAILATLFIVTGHWFLIVVFTLGAQYCGWLAFLCGFPQHYGMSPDVPDHRLSCRTFTCAWLPAFLYWNMQYHVEHHMFPAVPFFNLPKLRKVIEHDLPPAPRGLRATWQEMMAIHRRMQTEPNYCYVPKLPQTNTGARVTADDLEREAATL
ncbi:MAG: fatty acid desaturase [Verrucomicrobiota bacterium]